VEAFEGGELVLALFFELEAALLDPEEGDGDEEGEHD